MKKLPAILLALFVMVSAAAFGQDFPSRSIRIVDGFPPGNPGDYVARLTGPIIQRILGQPIVVENKPGVGGNLAVQTVSTAPADGYVLLIGPDTLFTVNPYLYTNGRVNAQRDVTPIMQLASGQLALACHPSVKASNFAELLALSKQEDLTYASGGNGSPAHLGTEYLKSVSGLRMEHVPYRGPAPAVNAIMAGETSCGLIIASAVVPLAESGRVRVLMVTGNERISRLPKVKTAIEQGLDGFVVENFLTLSVPNGTPATAVVKIVAAFNAALSDPDVVRTMKEAEVIPAPAPAEDLRRRINSTAIRWGDLIKRIGLKID